MEIKETTASACKALAIYSSTILYALSGGRYSNSIIERARELKREKRMAHINEMQKALDAEHETYRGWTSTSDRSRRVHPDPVRERMLEKQIEKNFLKNMEEIHRKHYNIK